MSFIFVALGGALGAAGRYALGLIPYGGVFPLKTLLINAVGSFLIGLFSGIFGGLATNKNLKLFLQTGVLGGFTTFSAFSLESIELMEQGRYALSAGYIAASVACGLLGVWLGKRLSGLIFDVG